MLAGREARPARRRRRVPGAGRRTARSPSATSASWSTLPAAATMQTAAAILVVSQPRSSAAAIAAMLASSPRIERPSGWSGIGRRLEMVEDDVVGRVARLAEFLQHDLPSRARSRRRRSAARHEIGDQLHPSARSSASSARVEHGHVARGIGVERAADVLDLPRRLRARPRAPAPLNTICSTRCATPLVPSVSKPRAGIDVERRPRPSRRAAIGCDHDLSAVGKRGQPGGHRRGVARSAI